MISLVVLTSVSNRHKFFVNTLAQHFNILGVVVEEKRPEQIGETEQEGETLKKHFDERRNAENKYFGQHEEFLVPENAVLRVPNGESNSEATFEWVKEKNPDFVILFGTSIIRDPLLSYYEGRMINIHLGLSPYYRGSGTNFWPLVNNEPECVGATIHLAILKVDAGSILAQVRPEVQEEDGSHDVGCKTIVAGAQAMIMCIEKYANKEITAEPQDLTGGRVYKRADFYAGAVEIMWSNFKKGMIKNYLQEKGARDEKFPIKEL